MDNAQKAIMIGVGLFITLLIRFYLHKVLSNL